MIVGWPFDTVCPDSQVSIQLDWIGEIIFEKNMRMLVRNHIWHSYMSKNNMQLKSPSILI